MLSVSSVTDAIGARRRSGPRGAGGFTLIETLIAISIIAVLIGLIAVALSGALGQARRTATASTLGTIGQAIGVFKNELGYEPPLLTPGDPDFEFGVDGYQTGSFIVPQVRFFEPTASVSSYEAMARHRFASEFSLTVYLMGIGDVFPDDDALSSVEDDGIAGPGIANPGRDRSWGGAFLRASHSATPSPALGPYLDPGAFEDSLELVEVDGSPGSGSRGLYRLNDVFGYGIRYYQGWPTRMTASLAGEVPGISADEVGTSTALFAPPELREVESWERLMSSPDSREGREDSDLSGATWALLSAGQDGREVDTSVPPALSASREALQYVPPFGDATLVDEVKEVFVSFPAATTSDQITALGLDGDGSGAYQRMRNYIGTNVRALGR